MIVNAKWDYFNGQKLKLNLIEITYCCDELKNSSAVTFGEIDSTLNTNSDVNISSCEPYHEGAVFIEEAINFCPFCGDKIIVAILDDVGV